MLLRTGSKRLQCSFDVDPSKCLEEGRRKRCDPSSIPNWDEWKFAGSGSSMWSRNWQLLSNYHWQSMAASGGTCKNDFYDNIRIYKAEKGTKIILYANPDHTATGTGGYAVIEFLKNFHRDWFPVGHKYGPPHEWAYRFYGGIRINGFEHDETDNEYYKMTYHHRGGEESLNRRVSSLRVEFPHRDR